VVGEVAKQAKEGCHSRGGFPCVWRGCMRQDTMHEGRRHSNNNEWPSVCRGCTFMRGTCHVKTSLRLVCAGNGVPNNVYEQHHLIRCTFTSSTNPRQRVRAAPTYDNVYEQHKSMTTCVQAALTYDNVYEQHQLMTTCTSSTNP